MRSIGKVIGFIIWIGSGILMFIFWFMAMSKWLGLFGSILAIVLAPGIVIFPFLFWLLEGIFPVFYFVMWGTGIVGVVIATLSGGDIDDQRLC